MLQAPYYTEADEKRASSALRKIWRGQGIALIYHGRKKFFECLSHINSRKTILDRYPTLSAENLSLNVYPILSEIHYPWLMT